MGIIVEFEYHLLLLIFCYIMAHGPSERLRRAAAWIVGAQVEEVEQVVELVEAEYEVCVVEYPE